MHICRNHSTITETTLMVPINAEAMTANGFNGIAWLVHKINLLA